MRDLIFNVIRKRNTVIHYHVVSWFVFILYEITLAAAIRERFNHLSDYLLHYLLYILLFYVHCYIVLGDKQFNRRGDYWKFLSFLLAEIICYYLCSLLIAYFLVESDVPVNITERSSILFQLATVYRCIYIIGLSTAFWITLNLMKNRIRIHDYVTQTLASEKEKAILEAELVSFELAFLRSQINPHLVFNCLNSIYNRIRKKDAISAEYVMALSELMQYALKSRAATEEVELKSELEHISYYIALQQMRYSTKIEFKTSIQEYGAPIIPLILISFIENIYQHGNLRNPQCLPMVEITTSEGTLTLKTRNQIRRDATPGNGVGLKNTLKRLKLHYPGNYLFECFTDQNIFHLKLIVKLR